jgi:hypothetical protein
VSEMSSSARAASESQRAALTRSLASAVPVVTAAMLGLLYGLGVMLNATELIGAHLRVSQTLPLIPLQDHLTKGLGAVFSSPVLAVYAVVGYVGGIALVASSRRMSVRIDEAGALAERASKEAESLDPTAGEAVLDDLRARAAAVLKDAELAATQEEMDAVKARYQTLSDDVDKMGERAKESREKVAAVKALIAESDAKFSNVRERLDRERRVIDRFRKVLKPFAVVLAVSALFSAASAAWAAVALAAGMWWYSEQDEPPHFPVWAAFILGLVVLAFVVDEYVNPTPLPTVTLVTTTGTVKGGLITSSGGRYVVTKAPHTFQTYPAAVVKSADSHTHSRPRSARVVTLLGRVFD